jgi:beta-lactamase superfamily II metal-dependent hydrolase
LDGNLSENNCIAECHFLDVGQGTSNVILLGERRGIVIDCGSSGRVPLQLLRQYVDHIVALIISHNDKDHHGGASRIIAAYPKAIGRIYFLQDRPVEQIKLFGLVKQAMERGDLLADPIRLERDDAPRILFSDEKINLSLELIFPTFSDNLKAQSIHQPNQTSAVLILCCGKRKIVFPGDSSIDDWRLIHHRHGGPISTDIFNVPHHGGYVSNLSERKGARVDNEEKMQKDLHWLYSKGVRCKFAVISVGTNNGHGHPRANTISALTSTGSHVLCTQITSQCHNDLEQLRPGVRRADYPSQSRGRRDSSTSGKSRNVACAGTIIAEIGVESVIIRRFEEHQRGVYRLLDSQGGHPLCLVRKCQQVLHQ